MISNIDRQVSINEITILPSKDPNEILSRSEINTCVYDSFQRDQNRDILPIFISPMTTVVCEDNIEIFEKLGLNPIFPRIGDFVDRCAYSEEHWVAFSLAEFERIVEEKVPNEHVQMYICIDMANGHMEKIYTLAKKAKKTYNNITLMVGNIANPEMYRYCCDAHIEYVRVGIGGGSVCTTSAQTGIHASLPYIISEINKYKALIDDRDRFTTRVIADGGIDTIDKAIKCIAMGYDYVMMGKAIAQSFQACGPIRTHITTYNGNDIYANGNLFGVDENVVFTGDAKKVVLERLYYGMSSEHGQEDISGGANKNPEGIEKWVEVKYPISKFVKQFEDALKSSMSYVGVDELYQFRQSANCALMSRAEYDAYYKA